MINRLPFSLLMMASAFAATVPLHMLHAQVSTNLGALPTKPTSAHTPTHSTGRAQSTPTAHQSPAPPPQPQTPSGYTHSLEVPPTAPPQVVIAPPFTPIPTHPAVPPDEVKPVPAAHSHAEMRPDQGMRVQFAPTSSDMDSATIEALQTFGAQAASHPEKRLILHSFAVLPGDDLSMPRRIALSRALAVRSILIRSGVATTRIYPLAHGRPEATDHEPADRLDITVEANPEDGPPPTSVTARDTFSSDKQGAPTP